MTRFLTEGRRAIALRTLTSASLMLYVGTVMRSGFGFLMGLVIARLFGADGYGVFYTYIIALMLWLSLGEALDQSVVRFYTYRLYHDKERAGQVLGSSLLLRALCVGVLMAIFGACAALFFPGGGENELTSVLVAGMFSGTLSGLITFAAAIFISRERFFHKAFILTFLNATRFAVLCGVIFLAMADLLPAIWYDVMAILAFAILALWLVRADLSEARFDRATFWEIADFSKWMAGATVTYLLFFGLGVPVLGYYWGQAAAGIYGAAISFAILVEHGTAAIMQVQTQRASKVRTVEDLRVFRMSVTRTSLICAAIMAPIAFIGGPIIVLTYGAEFEMSAAIFPLVLAGSIVHMISAPHSLTFVATNQPKFLAYGAFVGFAVWAACAPFLIPQFAVWGAVIAVLIARIAQGVFFVVLSRSVARVRSAAGEVGTISEMGGNLRN